MVYVISGCSFFATYVQADIYEVSFNKLFLTPYQKGGELNTIVALLRLCTTL